MENQDLGQAKLKYPDKFGILTILEPYFNSVFSDQLCKDPASKNEIEYFTMDKEYLDKLKHLLVNS